MPTDEISKLKKESVDPRRLSASCDEFNFFFTQMILRLEGSVCLKIMTYDLSPLFERGHLFYYQKDNVIPVDKLKKYDLVSYWDGEQINYALFLHQRGAEIVLLKWNRKKEKEVFSIIPKHYWARLPSKLSFFQKLRLRLF